MVETTLPETRPVEMPAACFNLCRQAQRRFGPRLELWLPGLPGNRVSVSDGERRCCNRRLKADLLTWSDFRVAARRALDEPVVCAMTVHHTYSRTILHRVHDSAADYLRRLLERDVHDLAECGRLLAWPGTPVGRRRPEREIR
jgi:hypothetical protein